MKNPMLLKANVTRDEAKELIDYLYCEFIEVEVEDLDEISWYSKGKKIAKWTEEYKNIMISKDFLEKSIDNDVFI